MENFIKKRDESENFLAINLSDKIVKDVLTPEQAKQAYKDGFIQIQNGENPELSQKFQFPCQ
ncbi:MAG: hypothetical protein MZV64_27660 [Ignavibacteriales bacterium]|nr:hypothetical protein [Ignavibacteriales bacterium]